MNPRGKCHQTKDFFTAASEVEKISPIKPKSIKRYIYRVKNPKNYSGVLGEESRVRELVWDGRIAVISSPEAEAIGGVGCINGAFKLPRFHLGIPAQMDMEVAMWQLANSRTLKKIAISSNANNSGIIYFAREGGITQWQKVIYLLNGKSVPTTLVSIHHSPAENKFERVAEISQKINLEGMPLKTLENLYLCDPVASGMQQVKMIEELCSMGAKPKRIIVIAPMGTSFGLRVIQTVCQSRGIEFYAGVCGALLDSTKPLRYFSPYPPESYKVADRRLHKFIHEVFGEDLNKFCIRCNWTGSFWAGDEFPHNCSEEELAAIGLSNKKLAKLSHKMNQKLEESKIMRKRLIPYSTRVKE